MPKKLTMNMVAWGNLRRHPKQYGSLILGILLATVFACGVPFLTACLEDTRQESHWQRIGKQTEIVLDAAAVEKAQKEGLLSAPPGYLHSIGFVWTEDPEKGTAVGWLDEKGEELYYLQMKTGRMPQGPGEISVEDNALRRLAPDAKVGDRLRLNIRSGTQRGVGEFTLTGIVESRKLFLEQEHKKDLSAYPAAYVLPGTAAPEDIPIGLVQRKEESRSIYPLAEPGSVILTGYQMYSHPLGGESTAELTRELSAMLGLLACMGIALAFHGNLRQRRQQIGLLRAVGATGRQIVTLYGREALALAVICAPLGAAAAGLAVWGLTRWLGLVFRPKPWMILRGAAVSILAVLLSVFLPLAAAAGCSPLQAIRKTELSRIVRRKKIRSRKLFRMPSLMASRRLSFYGPGRWLTVGILVISTLLLGNACRTFSQELANQAQGSHSYDYEIYPRGMRTFGETGYINTPGVNRLMSDGEAKECRGLPGVQKVEGVKRGLVNLVGPMDPYLELWSLDPGGADAKYIRPSFIKEKALTEAEFQARAFEKLNPNYLEAREIAGYEEDVFNLFLFGLNRDNLPKAAVVAGEINPEKLDSGEEVLLCAPQEIGYILRDRGNGVWTDGLRDLTPEADEGMWGIRPGDLDYVLSRAKSPFRVGDMLHLSMLSEDHRGNLQRTDRVVRVGAIVSSYFAPYQDNKPAILTTTEAMDRDWEKLDYHHLYVTMEPGFPEADDSTMQKDLEALFHGQKVKSLLEVNRYWQTSLRNSFLSMVCLFAVLLGLSCAMVASGVTARLRGDRRTIGTMRALGAGGREIALSYGLELIRLVLQGLCLGAGASLIAVWMGKITMWDVLPAVILHLAVLGCSWIHLRLELKRVLKYSIVENIREL